MENIIEWAKLYLKHKDIVKKNIIDIKEDNNSLFIETKEGKELGICSEDLPIDIPNLEQYNKLYIFVKHKKENLNALIQRWEELTHIKILLIFFVDYKKDKKWIISPFSHSKVASDNIEKSLKALYSNAE